MTGLRAAGGRVRLLAAAATVVAGTLLVGVPGAAAHPGDTEIQVSPAEADAGSTVTVTGEGFTAGTDVAVVLRTAQGDEPLASTTVDDEGHFETVVELAGSLDSRYYEVRAVGSAETASQLLAVSADPGAASDPGAGSDPVGRSVLPALLLAGAGALGGLAVLVLLARRRGPVGTPAR